MNVKKDDTIIPQNNKKIKEFRNHIEKTYRNCPPNRPSYSGSFGEILCYELHSQPINPRMRIKTGNDGYMTGLSFKELAAKWGISVTFLGDLIADHCRKLEE
jgi:hypothetical protein